MSNASTDQLGCAGPDGCCKVHTESRNFGLSMPSRLTAPDCPQYLLAPSSTHSSLPMQLGELSTPSSPPLACRSAHWLDTFVGKNRFEPLLSADPNQPIHAAAGRCTRARSCGCFIY
jgi:hypothetical protein